MVYDPKLGYDPHNPDDPRRNEAVDPRTGQRLPASESHTEPVKAFRLKTVDNPSMQPTHTHNGKRVAPGETVYLTETQATAFKDRFEPVDPKANFAPRGISREAYQAQVDKATAEARAATAVASTTLRTEDDARGTLKADPEGTAQQTPPTPPDPKKTK